MRFTRKAAIVAIAGACALPAVAAAHLVSVPDPRGDAKGPFDLRSTSMGENRATHSLAVAVSTYTAIPRRTPGVPCVEFDYADPRGADRFACQATSGAHYDLRDSRTGRLVTRLAYARPDANTVRIAVSGRLLDGDGAIKWRAYLEGENKTVTDVTRWSAHGFAD